MVVPLNVREGCRSSGLVARRVDGYWVQASQAPIVLGMRCDS